MDRGNEWEASGDGFSRRGIGRGIGRGNSLRQPPTMPPMQPQYAPQYQPQPQPSAYYPNPTQASALYQTQFSPSVQSPNPTHEQYQTQYPPLGQSTAQYPSNPTQFAPSVQAPTQYPPTQPSAPEPETYSPNPRAGPRFIPPSADFPSLTESATSTTSTKASQKPFRGKTPKFTRDTAAKRAPANATHPFLLQQQALRAQKEDFERKQQRQERRRGHGPADDFDSGDEDEDDDQEEGPQASLLHLIGEKFRKDEEELVSQQQEELINEGVTLNPAMPVEWLHRALMICFSGDQADVIYPRHDEVLGSEVPIGTMQDNMAWMEQIQREYDRQAPLSLDQCFSASPNPYLIVLYMLENNKRARTCKSGSVSAQILRHFERWIGKHKQQYKHCLDPTVKVHALYTLSRPWSMPLFEAGVKCYELCHSGNGYLLPFVRQCVFQHQYKDAAQIAAKLKLHDFFSVEEIIKPLLFQGKVTVLEKYVFQHYPQQEALVCYLDHLVSDEDVIPHMMANCRIPEIQRESLEMKKLLKLALRLMKLYQVPREKCPNVIREQGKKSLRYLLYKTFIEQGYELPQFEELAQGTVGSVVELQYYLVDKLVDYSIDEATRWAIHYGLSGPDVPIQVTERIQQGHENKALRSSLPPIGSHHSPAPSYDPEHYHGLGIPLEAVLWVEEPAGVLSMLAMMEGLEDNALVGMDAEWRPTITENTVSRMALMQIATTENVFLLDMIALAQSMTEADWAAFAEKLFANPDLVKLAYGFDGDMQMLMRVSPALKKGLQDTKNLVDLQGMQASIVKNDASFFSATESTGLAGLVSQCLGKPLNKREQMSDWERRPLRPEQMLYAALDAYCLLEIYTALSSRLRERGMEVNALAAMTTKTAPRKQQRTKAERRQQRVADKSRQGSEAAPNPPPCTGPPIRASEFRVVTDTMLQGLGRQLRCCGVDVVMTQPHEDHDQCAKIAQRDDRVILTSGAPYMTLRSAVPLGMCYNVSHTLKAKEQCTAVLQHYNVTVGVDDIFSRCQVCNGNQYLYISPAQMEEAWNRKQQLLHGADTTTSGAATATVTTSSNTADTTDSALKSQSTMSSSATSSMTTPSSSSSVTETDVRNDQATINPNQASTNPNQATTNPREPRNWQGRETSALHRRHNQEDVVYDSLDMGTLCISENVEVQVEKVPQPMLGKVDVFYVCAGCGKVFWEGTHFQRVREQFDHVIGQRNNTGNEMGNHTPSARNKDDVDIVFA